MKKHRLYKNLALLGAAVVIVSIGSKKAIEIKTSKEDDLTTSSVDTTSLKTEKHTPIFEDPELLEIPESSTFVKETESDGIITKSRFESQEDLEKYLEQIYSSSNKSYFEIIENNQLAEENGNFYSYRSDLSVAASYKLLQVNNINLKDITYELNYLLYLYLHPCEPTIEDKETLKILYDLVDEEYNIYEIFSQLALENHLLTCEHKNIHVTDDYGLVCPSLTFENIRKSENKKDSEVIELGPTLSKRIRELTRM